MLSLSLITQCSNILCLIDLVLTIPASTAECERGFSVMGQIKSDWRSSLSPETVDDLMKVLMQSPNIDSFDPSEAIQLWLSSSARQRRPDAKELLAFCSDSEDECDDVCAGVSRLQGDLCVDC